MGLLMLALLLLSAAFARVCDFGGDIKKMYVANSNGRSTYQDHNGTLRNSANGHVVTIGESSKYYDSWTGELLYNPVANKEKIERERCEKLGYSKHRVFNNSTEECINLSDYGHKYVYREFDSADSALYGKLNCNLGYQFWVDLKTGYMEETELSKSIDHTGVKKYHKKLVDNRRRKIDKYTEDYKHPYTKEELVKENDKILEHLENHNRNIKRPDISKFQKFTPSWCYNPYHEHDVEYLDGFSQDNLIFDFERSADLSIMPKREEGWYD